MSKSTGRSKSGKSGGVSFWEAARDVFIASLNRGQFPVAIAGAIVALMIFRMPKDDVSKLAFQILNDLKSGWLGGYLLSVILAIGWLKHSRWQRREIALEMDRIGRQKTLLQEKLLQKKLPSSKE